MPSQYWIAPLVTAQASGPTLTSAAAASCIPTGAKYTLPGGFFSGAGRQLQIEAWGKISCVVTTPGTATFDVRLGSIVVFNGGAVPLNIVAKTDVGWHLDILLTCLTIGTGTAATLRGQGRWTSQASIAAPGDTVAGCGTFILPYNTAPGSAGNGFDSTAAQLLDLFFTQTVGTGSLTLLQYTVRG